MGALFVVYSAFPLPFVKHQSIFNVIWIFFS